MAISQRGMLGAKTSSMSRLMQSCSRQAFNGIVKTFDETFKVPVRLNSGHAHNMSSCSQHDGKKSDFY